MKKTIGNFAHSASFSPFSTTYTTPGTQTISIPAGATSVVIECIGAGSSGVPEKTGTYGGNGGDYAKTTISSLSGYSALYISVPAATAANTPGASAFVKRDNSTGTTLCRGYGGGPGSGSQSLYNGSLGDVIHYGGEGANSNGGGGAGAAVRVAGEAGARRLHLVVEVEQLVGDQEGGEGQHVGVGAGDAGVGQLAQAAADVIGQLPESRLLPDLAGDGIFAAAEEDIDMRHGELPLQHRVEPLDRSL